MTPSAVICSTPRPGVDQRDIVAVERLQVFVVEAGRLHWYPYHGLSASAVAASVTIDSTRARISSILAKSAISAAFGPTSLTIGIFLVRLVHASRRDPHRKTSGTEDLEVLHPSLLPAGLQRCGPSRFGLTVGPHVDRRRGALEDQQLTARLGESRYALDCRRAGADDSDPLV